jgi:glycosyltransferase involved in cell wall biosynthesis
MFAAKLLGREYVVRVGGGYIWEKYLSQGKPPMPLKEFYERGLYKQYKVMYWLIKKVLQRAYLVIFNSDEQRELYRTFYKLEYRRIITIYNAVPEHKFGNLLQSYKMRNYDRDKEFVFAGRFIKMKNVESLIRAFAKVQDREFKLLLIGEGPTEPELHSIVKELKLEHRVTFMKPLSQLELYRRIANCYCVIIPSWTDISPHQAYECLALGIPFLLTKENYLSINKKNFVKIDPNSVDDIAEKMNWLLDGEHYMEFTESLEKLRFKRTWADVVSDHMKIFATMI